MKTQNEKLVHDFYQALEGYDFLTLKSLCSSDFVFYSQIDNPIHGVDGFIASETATLDGFRGFSMKPEVLISEADKVVAYVVLKVSTIMKCTDINQPGKSTYFSDDAADY